MGNCFLYKRGFGGASGGGSTPEVEKTASGKVIFILDSVEKPLKGLRLFGKTTQNGTPSPDAPVPMVNVGDGGSIRTMILPAIKSLEDDALFGIPVPSGGNHIDAKGQQWVCDEVDFARGKYVQRLGVMVFDGSSDEIWNYANSYIGYPQNTTLYSRIWTPLSNVGFAPLSAFMCDKLIWNSEKVGNYGPVYGAELWANQNNFHIVPGKGYPDSENNIDTMRQWLAENPITVLYELANPIITDLTAEELLIFAEKYGGSGCVCGRTTQNGIPTPDTPAELINHADVFQSVPASTPNGLPGIHVSEGGNYTDENGWQWICDEVDFARGKYVQRLGVMVFDGSSDETWNYGNSYIGYPQNTTLYSRIWTPLSNVGFAPFSACMCDKLLWKSEKSGSYNPKYGAELWANNNLHIVPGKGYLDSENNIDTMRQWLANNPITVLYELANPIETPLNSQELAQYAALHTLSLSTTIYNDADSYMEVKYMAKGG